MATQSQPKSESFTDVQRWWQQQSANLWPTVLGSLSFRRSPCIRPNCTARLSGEKHPSYVLYGRQQGRRFSLYVPEELVPQVQRWLDNGHALQELLYPAASRNLQALKRARDQVSKLQKGRTERCPGLRSHRSVSPMGSCYSKGISLEPLLQNISDFLDDHEEMIEAVRHDLERGLKIPLLVAVD
jgi:hypothetical protein